MGFNIYFAGNLAKNTDAFLQENGGNRLYNQLYERGTIGKRWMQFKTEQPEASNNLFVDSSAYSAHTKGAVVDIDNYIQYLNDNVGVFSVIAELDVIPGEFQKPKTFKQLTEAPQLSWDNYLYMRERMIEKEKLIPIFHMGEDFKWLHLMLDTTFENDKHIPYIGISPANDSVTKYKDKWIEQVFRVIHDSKNPNVKTHAFGMTVLSQLERHPFHSADSTSPVLTSAMGNIFTHKGLISLSRKSGGVENFYRLPKTIQNEVLTIIDETGLGFTIEELADSHKPREVFNAQFVLDWAENYEFRGIKNKQKTLFTR